MISRKTETRKEATWLIPKIVANFMATGSVRKTVEINIPG